MAGDVTIKIAAENEASKVLTKVGRDVGKLGNDVQTAGDKIKTGMGVAAKAFAAFGVAAAAATAAAAVAGVRSELERIDRVAKSSRALGIATEDLVGLTLAAEEFAGVSASVLDSALKKQANSVSEAAQGVGEARKTFEELGLSAEELNNLTTDEAFREIADAISKVGNQTDRLRMTQDIYGRGASQMVLVLEQGAAGFDKMNARAAELGLTFSDLDAANVEEVNDAITELKAGFTGLATELTTTVAPALLTIVERLQEVTIASRTALSGLAQVFGFSGTEGGVVGSAIKGISSDVGNSLMDSIFGPAETRGQSASGVDPFADIFPAESMRPLAESIFGAIEKFFKDNTPDGPGIGPVTFAEPEPLGPTPQLAATESRLLSGKGQGIQEKLLSESKSHNELLKKLPEQIADAINDNNADTLKVEQVG